ncbi:FAD-dependent monooxygenase [Rhizobium sp. TRM95796]|uniref:FAD-dependent monooxygenase n=1 Tax=Rhizobium sp. TRM95796 TaxID=2979862 RepID=UPI0021E93668|nr:FAD-dependent monooxygenase [Rhizobium sp. TRM95796]MCV3768851.1 FAD-dependent monooxygenase [Rhizobium sp. TRM95796]
MQILIVGAGIAGLAMHRALSLRGVKATIVERSNFAGVGGAALFLPGNAMRAVKELGLAQPVLDRSHPILHQRFCDQRGRQYNVVETEDFWREVGPCRSIKRSIFWDLLMSSVAPEDIEFRQIVDVGSNREGCRVNYADGGSGSYDLVIGADGVRSTVRDIAFTEAARPAYVGNVCWRYLVPNTCGLKDWTVMLAANRSLLGIAVSNFELYVYADLTVDRANLEHYSTATPLEALFKDVAGPLLPALTMSADANIHFSELVRLQMTTSYRNRIVLVGDAAHASPPSMAQGAGMALEDAIVLAQELTVDRDIPKALARFEARRKPRVDWVHRQGSARDKMRRLPGPVRSALLRFAGQKLYEKAYRPLKAPI